MTLLGALHCRNPENVPFEYVHTKYILCLCICFSFQLWIIFSTTNRIKNRPLTIIEPKAHKRLNPARTIYISKLSFRKATKKFFPGVAQVLLPLPLSGYVPGVR